MTTATKSISAAKRPSSAGKKSFSTEEIQQEIKSATRKIDGSIVIRHLWTSNSMHRFRVNWWINGAMTTSKFIVVTEDEKKLTVREKT